MNLRNLVVVVLAVLVAFACRSVTSRSRYASLFAEAVTKVDDYALVETTEHELYEHAMNGMLQSLDEHSQYISGERFRAFTQQLKQEFGGVGMFVGRNPRTKELTVTATLPDTPAHRAGVRPGDVVLQIGEISTVQMLPSEAVRVIHGPIGEPVEIVLRRGSDRVRKSIVRGSIMIQTVWGERFSTDGSWNFLLPEDERIAYVHLTDFSEKTADELRSVLRTLEPTAEALILDLRSNGGGLLFDAVEICDMFLDRPQPIVEIRGRGNRLLESPYQATKECLFPPNKPMAILIDRYSASASEIVAACLKDLQRATVVGESSYGKGTVQSVVPLERNRSSIKITTATWWTPAGQNVDRDPQFSGDSESRGVQPNPGCDFEFDEETLFQVDLVRARRQFQSFEVFGLDANAPADDPATTSGPDSSGSESKTGETKLTEDPVLKRAIELLAQSLDQQSTT